MLNKILFKKIKFPPSLREAKQRSNISGFSLIELMVAITILAMGIFGIFYAFSAGFMGMADARDRTVATNYAREAMEDVKNMDFELVTNENLSTAEIIDAKFNRVITVADEHDNLKKITTRVFWNNRNGKPINVETTMYINRDQFTPEDAAKIILYVDTYYSVSPGSGSANIIAVIKDIKGNTKIDWSGGYIHFSILGHGYSDFDKNAIGSYLGYLGSGYDEISLPPNKGRADITFTSTLVEGAMEQGNVVIKASVDLPNGGGTISDTITIVISLDVVRIELSAVPDRIDADGTTISTVTTKLVNFEGGTVEDATNEITFNISGEGIFVDGVGSPLPNTIIMAPSVGEVDIIVKSIDDTPGVAIVTASSEGLLSDTVNIITTGDATSISVSVDRNLIYTDDAIGATVTVEIQDINGNPVEFNGNITLSTPPENTGRFYINYLYDNPYPFNFNSISPPSITYSSTTDGLITIIASGDGLIPGNTDIDVKDALIANNIALTAEPQNIPAGGETSEASTIKAIIRDDLTIVSTYSNDITFEIISDTSSSQTALLLFNSNPYSTGSPLSVTGAQYGSDGEAVVYLIPSNDVGICTIEVSTYDPNPIVNTIEVRFYSSAHHIELSAVPQKMLVGGDICKITVTIEDEGGTKVQNYNEEITFTFTEGHNSCAKFLSVPTVSFTKSVVDGVTFVDLVSLDIAGTVIIDASSSKGTKEIFGSLNIPVVITLLELAPAPNIIYGENQVSFDIEVQGADLSLEEMQVLWLPYSSEENVTHIKINTYDVYPPGDNVIIGYSIHTYNSENYRSAEVDINNEILPTGISTIEIFFNSDMSEKKLIIIFNPNFGNYPVEIIVPTI